MTDLVPFGKWKGFPIESLLNDKDYYKWFWESGAADTARQCHQEFYTALVTQGYRPQSTRRHNQIQALFSEPLYSHAFCRVAKPKWEENVWSEFVDEVSYAAHHSSPDLKSTIEQLPRVCWTEVSIRSDIEVKGIDVEIVMDVGIRRPPYPIGLREYQLPRLLQCPGESERFAIEIKPTMIDHPSTISQMRALGAKYLFIESFCRESTGIELERFLKIFENTKDGLTVVWKDDVDKAHEQLLEQHKQSMTIH